MPGVTVGVYTGQLDAGTEVSSTYEGRHITVREDELIHPYRSGTKVNKGDPVIVCDASTPGTYGNIVGVAFATGTAISDLIAVDTEGIWNLKVDAYDDAGESAIEIGDCLYIRAGSLNSTPSVLGTGDAEISKINDAATQVFFGYALGSMLANNSGRIAVKVHAAPFPEQEEVRYGTVTSGTYNYVHHWVGKLEAGRSNGVACYFAAEVAGTQTGDIYGGGLWIEPQSDYISIADVMTIWDLGIYCAAGGTLDMGNQSIYGIQMTLDLNESPTAIHWIRVNSSATTGVITAVFHAANPNSVGLIGGGVAGNNQIGVIPLFNVVGTGVLYVNVHDSYA